MSVRLPEGVETQFSELARATGRSKSYLLTEAVAQYLEREMQQIALIVEGLRSADAGRLVPHDDVVADLIAKGMATPEGLERAQAWLAGEW